MTIDIDAIVNAANKNEALMDGTTDRVKEVLDAADLVYAVWQQPEAEHGVETLVVKGLPALETIAESQTPKELRWTAIKVLDVNMAHATRDTLGDNRA